MANIDLSKFIEAHKNSYEVALAEIKSGKKRSHWMWYIFPQLGGLGQSKTSQFYAITNLDGAREYLSHEVLGGGLVKISHELLKLEENNAYNVFGSPDDVKLQSSMTLFSLVDMKNGIFQKVLDKFFEGNYDQKTIELLQNFAITPRTTTIQAHLPIEKRRET